MDSAAADKLAKSLKSNPPALGAEQLVAASDIVIECAAGSAVEPLVQSCVASGVSLVVMSVGGLKPEHFALFEGSGAVLHIPSGAVAGVDGILACAGGQVSSISLTTRKPPQGLKGAAALDEMGVSLDGLAEPLVVFEGPPSEAIKKFPKNINVSTTLALACGAGDSMTVRIVADPTIDTNIHEVRLESPYVNLFVRLENRPSPDNPKTSALAYMSAVAALKKLTSKVRIGT
jgi:aspartate dehydrogenase